jgi:hypothetical protein
MFPLVLGELVGHAKRLWSEPTIQWEPCEAETSELAAAESEAKNGAQFDKHGLKSKIWNGYKEGSVRLICKRLGTLARVVAFLPENVAEPNWEFWARIFQWFGSANSKKPWHVTWFAARAPRTFPDPGQDLGPEHVNGGYTHICSTDGIFIYREEEATRVLIHEMLHAACLDEVGDDWTIPLREAMIEMWAELILIALKSRGVTATAKRLWVKQSHWIADTNARAQKQHNEEDHTDYAWRYLSGRSLMYANYGISLPAARELTHRSLRFTHPDLEP